MAFESSLHQSSIKCGVGLPFFWLDKKCHIFVGLHCDCPLARRKKYEPPLKQILVTASPKFGESEGELGMPDSNENEILFPSETNPNCSCPKFGEVRGALRGPEAVFRHFVMKKSEPKARQFTLEVHGWYNQLKNLSYVHFSLS